MKLEETRFNGCYLISQETFKDKRGEFLESFNVAKFKELTGIETAFVQDNQSISKKNVLRGLHFQEGDHAQAKLVRVVHGKVLDVCVDLRQDHATFGQHLSIILDSGSNRQLYVPKGFAHGFLTLSESAIVSYKCDAYYDKSSEGGIIFNDSTLNIDWGIPHDQVILSDKDEQLPTFENLFK